MKTELNEVLEVVSKRLDHQVENEISVIHEEDNGKKKKSKDEAYLTDSSYAILDASENRHRGHCCDTPDDHDLDLDIITRYVVIEYFLIAFANRICQSPLPVAFPNPLC